MAGRRRSPRARRPQHGQHFLASRSLAADIVRDAGVTPHDLVLEIGAGDGALTTELARRARHVVAIEVDAALAARLRARVPAAEVVVADAFAVAPPGERFKVVANIPFFRTTDALAYLLDDPTTPLERADLIVEWGAALKRASIWPSTVRGVVWGAWFRFSISRHLPPTAFRPPPSVHAAVLTIERRALPLVPVERRDDFGAFVRRGFRHGPRAVASRSALKAVGVDSRAVARELDAHRWAALHRAVRGVR